MLDGAPAVSISLQRKMDSREVGSYDNVAGKSALLNRSPVIRFRQRARNLPGTLALRSNRRYQMRKHEILRACALRHGAEIGGSALAIKGIRKHFAALVRCHNWVNRRMHDDVSPCCQLLHLSRG